MLTHRPTEIPVSVLCKLEFLVDFEKNMDILYIETFVQLPQTRFQFY